MMALKGPLYMACLWPLVVVVVVVVTVQRTKGHLLKEAEGTVWSHTLR